MSNPADRLGGPLSTPMSTPLNAPASQASPASLDALLLQELELLRRGMADSLPPTGNGQSAQAETPLLVVARLVHGVARDQWERLRASMPAHGWCALEVCQRQTRLCAPHLADCETCDDPLTGALLAAPLMRQLHREAVRARRGHSQLALAVFTLEQDADQGLIPLAELIRRYMQDCDSLGLLDSQRLVLVLPGAGLFKAQALLEEMLAAVAAESLPPCTAGIAGGHPDDDGTSLLQQAVQALSEAQRQHCCLRVYREASDPLAERKTLVRSDEKRFLFSGGDI